MTGDRLTAVFSLDAMREPASASEDVSSPQPPAPPGDTPRTHAPNDSIENAADVDGGGDGADADADRSQPASHGQDDALAGGTLMRPGEADVVVTWSGPLVIEPTQRLPDDLAGPEDVFLALSGEPATVHTAGGEVVTAARVSYLASLARVQAEAGDDASSRIVLRSPELGVLKGRRLSLNQSSGAGYVVGPGRLESPLDAPSSASAFSPSAPGSAGGQPARPSDSTSTSASAPPTPASPADAETLEIAWQERLDLRFYLQEDEPSHKDESASLADAAAIESLRSATFRGQVVATHPQFKLTGDEVTLEVTPPRPGDSDADAAHAPADPTLDALHARGHVQLAARSPEDARAIDIAAQALDIQFAAPTRDDPASPPAQADLARLGIETLTAHGQVEVQLEQDDLTLTGDRLVVDAPADQIEVFGSAQTPAQVRQPGGTLTGEHIVFGRQTRTAHVLGPGAVEFERGAESDQAARISDLRVTWQEAMHFDHAHGVAEFVGDVHAATHAPDQQTTLTADTLQLELDPATDRESEHRTSNIPHRTSNMGRIRVATARGEVTFTADRFDPAAPDRLLTRFYLEGPVMTFDNRQGVEQVQVIGAGQMLFVDDRPGEPASAGGSNTESASTESVSSEPDATRGATLFLWDRQLVMDALTNQVTLTGGVEMLHRPANDQPPIQFWADRLVATLDAAAGFDAWAADDARQPELTQVDADGSIVIVRGPTTVTADHLRYTTDNRQVRLTAEPGRRVVVREQGRPTGASGAAITWNLATDAFSVEEFGGVTIPIRE